MAAEPVPGGQRAGGAAAAGDAALLRQTRLRLMAWSGGLTLLILLLLGTLVYVAVSSELASRGTAVLERRAAEVARIIGRGGPLPDRLPFGLAVGGEQSGTLTLAIAPDNSVYGRLDEIEGLPVELSVQAARETGSDVREGLIGETPIRVYTSAVERMDGQYIVQVIGERVSERRLLAALMFALIVGSLAALGLAIAAGWVYAGRALVPIRAAIDRREAALQRQREFAANASHELRTPLTVIRASVTDLRRNPAQPVAAVGTALEDIDAETTHLATLVDDLLLLARTDAGTLELEQAPVDLADVAVEATAALTSMAAARSVTVTVDPRPGVVEGDALRLRQLVTILVDNAVAHTPAGGSVMVRVRAGNKAAVLTVEDTGQGIRPDDLSRVFERFWRADDAPSGGTGLGLAIAAWIVERHGGRIAAANRPEGGARFEAQIPLRG
ncbi:MAG TPA: ATP-binding protein [Patescibacteria group bacterium]|nr:ATP-binding protein [Patescibacteria group bacterium]